MAYRNNDKFKSSFLGGLLAALVVFGTLGAGYLVVDLIKGDTQEVVNEDEKEAETETETENEVENKEAE